VNSITPERYKNWLELLVEGNQNMIRVWGGGIYEHDTFYDTCDGQFIPPFQEIGTDCYCRAR